MKNEKGFTLLETLVALALLLVVAAGVLPLGILAFSTSENQGHLSARAAEYAQDKLEQLLALCTATRRRIHGCSQRRKWAAPASPSAAAAIRRRR